MKFSLERCIKCFALMLALLSNPLSAQELAYQVTDITDMSDCDCEPSCAGAHPFLIMDGVVKYVADNDTFEIVSSDTTQYYRLDAVYGFDSSHYVFSVRSRFGHFQVWIHDAIHNSTELLRDSASLTNFDTIRTATVNKVFDRDYFSFS